MYIIDSEIMKLRVRIEKTQPNQQRPDNDREEILFTSVLCYYARKRRTHYPHPEVSKAGTLPHKNLAFRLPPACTPVR